MGKNTGNYISLVVLYGLASTVNRKLKKKIHKLGKGDDRILVLQLARSRTKKTKRNQDKN